ncbi:LysR family transcriptional regulator [uncultured Thalassolituus sp.]|uniref:LysR family transcriptional regulator n=1 Tax=uncultured Thalassolituus sp. TaxID=285273 RepID=UPI00261E9A4A|nr:LysR family transcriptional regulator [uncultured Thalassolituus sp.]
MVNIRNFDLNLLVIFDALMRERNVSRVAEKLSLSQPAVSNALNRLRTLLDDQLLVRTSQGMQPTALALELEEPLREAIQQIEHTLSGRNQFDPSSSQVRFRIATTDYAELALMPRLLSYMRAMAPGIQFDILDLPPETPTKALEDGELDLCIGRFGELPPRIRRTPFLKEHLVVACDAEHPQITNDLSLDTFLSLQHIWVSGGQRRGVVDMWLDENRLERNIVMVTPNYLGAPHLVIGSEMAVVLPKRMADEYANLLPIRCVPLPLPIPPFDVDIITSALRNDDAALQWLIKILRHQFTAL